MFITERDFECKRLEILESKFGWNKRPEDLCIIFDYSQLIKAAGLKTRHRLQRAIKFQARPKFQIKPKFQGSWHGAFTWEDG